MGGGIFCIGKRGARFPWHELCLLNRIVKLQLTKDKTIEINLPGFSGGGAKSANDITGVEMFSPYLEACPAVRLVYRKKAWHLTAAAMLGGPKGELPERWEDTPHQPVWELPREFVSPHAALAVNSAMGSFSQSTADAILQEMASGLAAAESAASASADPGSRRFGIKRAAAPAPKNAPTQQSAPAHKIEFPKPGSCVSENGRRFIVRPMAEEGFHLCASLPEFQALWVSRLLPEGHRPTASSIQVAESALMASILLQPEFRAADGNALAIFVRRNAIFLAGFKKGEGVLWRRCPSIGGTDAMRTAMKQTLGIDDDLIDAVLKESLIDPRPALEPFLHPLLSQLELSLAYLSSKHGLKFDKAFLMGLGAGSAHWSAYTEEALHLRLVAPDPFEGLVKDKGVDVPDAEPYLVALGAAIAGTEATL